MINLEASKNIHLSTYPDKKFDTQPLEKFFSDLASSEVKVRKL